MTAFFEHLMAEQDPTRIATMAETMPDPPDLAGVAASISEPADGAVRPERAGAAGCRPVAEITEAASRRAGSAGRPGERRPRPARRPTDFAAAEAEAASFTGDLGEDDELRQPAEATESELPRRPSGGDAPARQTAAERRAGQRDPGASVRGDGPRPASSSWGSSASRASRRSSEASGAPAASAASRVASGPDGEFVFTVEPRCGPEPAPTRSPGCPGSRHGSPPRPPTASRSPHTTPTPPADDPESEESPVSRPAVVVALPPTESGVVCAELSSAGFEVIPVTQPRELEQALEDRRDIGAGDPRRRGRYRPGRLVRDGAPGCRSGHPGTDRRLAAGVRAAGRPR